MAETADAGRHPGRRFLFQLTGRVRATKATESEQCGAPQAEVSHVVVRWLRLACKGGLRAAWSDRRDSGACLTALENGVSWQWVSLRLARDGGGTRGKHLQRAIVLETAAGLQGEQPLVTWNKVDKGSRQNGSVTLGQGLALVFLAAAVWQPPQGGCR